MTKMKNWIAALSATAMLLLTASCNVSGKVQQGRTIAFDQKTGTVTLIPEAADARSSPAGVLPPITVKIPADPDEMGPAPVPGKLLILDRTEHKAVVFDAATQSLLTISYTPLSEQNATKAPKSLVDRVKKTITLYSKDQHVAITIAATDELLALPDDTWRAGDLVRYYYQDPAQSLRFMNVTRTDLSKSGG